MMDALLLFIVVVVWMPRIIPEHHGVNAFMIAPLPVFAIRKTSQKSQLPPHNTPFSLTLKYGLYEVQEDMLTKRAQFEETLMTNNNNINNNASSQQQQPLMANKPKGTGTSGGFGSSSNNNKNSKKKQTSSRNHQQGFSHAQVVRSEGVVRIDQILSADVADAMRSFVLEYRSEAQRQVFETQQIPFRYRFADVLLRKNRSDVTMPLNDITYKALYQVLCQSSVGATFETLLGKNAMLQEFSCLISDSGSDRQVIHPDTPFLKDSTTTTTANDKDTEDPVLCTCFIALQDITPEMGPTVWLPQTHTRAIHAQFMDETIAEHQTESPKDALLRSRPAVVGTLPRGCCAIYDSRVLHCGTANRSNTSRALFYISFKRPNISYTGNPPSIRPELQGKLSLGQLQQQLESWFQGKGCPELDAIAKTMI
jgi:ectoine hydroxylase-related dioxygenase (phytanoyl-CoA dioxygenase family)